MSYIYIYIYIYTHTYIYIHIIHTYPSEAGGTVAPVGSSTEDRIRAAVGAPQWTAMLCYAVLCYVL